MKIYNENIHTITKLIQSLLIAQDVQPYWLHVQIVLGRALTIFLNSRIEFEDLAWKGRAFHILGP